MTFAHIEMLFLFWVVPLLLLAYGYGWRRRRRILDHFADRRALTHLVPAGLDARRHLQAGMVLLAALLLVLAMAGPRYGFRWQTVERRGVDLIIALDCSRSMLAQDIQPSRLDRAKREIIDLLDILQGDRVGLVAFSGTAFLQCPLTLDYAAFDLFLNVLTPDYLPVGGTDMSAAVLAALNGFDPQSPAEKAIILLTDGEHTGRTDPETAAREARKAGIKLFCIGVGATEGVPVPSGQGGFQKDADGQIVLTRLDETLLTRMAVATGGIYVRSVAGDMDLDRIYHDRIRGAMDSATLESGRKQVWADRYQWPLCLALALLLTAWVIPEVKKGLTAICVCLAVIGVTARPVLAGPLQDGYRAYQQGRYDAALKHFLDGQVRQPDHPAILYNIGNTYYKTGDFDTADAYYRQALSQAPPELKAKLLYNLGNSAYRRQALDEAVKNYQAALDIDARDEQAQANLDFVREQLKKRQQQQSSAGDKAQGEPPKNHEDPERAGSQPPEDSSGQSQPQAQHGPSPDDPMRQQDAPQYGSEMENSAGESTPPDGQAASGDSTEAATSEQQAPSPAAVQMLNRLKDEPGRAMMPNYRKQSVDKDW